MSPTISKVYLPSCAKLLLLLSSLLKWTALQMVLIVLCTQTQFVLSMDSWWQGGTQDGGRRDVSDGCVTPAHLKTPESEGLPPLPFWGRDPRR